MGLKRILGLLSFLLTAGLLYFLSYTLPRSAFPVLVATFGGLFFLYQWQTEIFGQRKLFRWGIIAAIVFRILMLFAFPNLSDDIYRFVWDGNNLAAGQSPYDDIPKFELENNKTTANTHALYDKLNSQEYYSVYPPVCQAIFLIAAKVAPQDLFTRTLILKIFLLLFEIGSIILIIRLLRLYSLPEENVLLYALNPLAIVEIVGNVHFEGAMIFFTLLALYALKVNRWIPAAVALGLAVGAKLLPLIFLPLFFKKMPFQRFVLFCGLTILVALGLFLPFSSLTELPNLFQSIQLYFEKFEFNASVFYGIRYIGFFTHGYNIHHLVAPYLTLGTFLLIMIYAWVSRTEKQSNLPVQMLFALTIYLALATIVHPWYIVPLVALSVFTKYRFAIAWSFLVTLSYFAYSNPAYVESMKLILVEYVIVFAYLIYDIVKSNRSKALS